MTEKEPPLILIVEDNLANFILEAHMLGLVGIHSVEWAADGFVAFEKALNCKPDLILLDLRMPGKDGYGVYKELASHEETKRIPVVIVTAEASTAQRDKALSYGVAEFFEKPLDPSTFGESVQNILRGIQFGLYDTE